MRNLLATPIKYMNIFELIQAEKKIMRLVQAGDFSEFQKYLSKHMAILQRIADLALRDPLTQLLNRTGYKAIMSDLIQCGLHRETDLCHAIIDIDDFKRINTNYSHDIGDSVLKNLADLLREELNHPSYKGSYAAILGQDHPVRLGGEEIAIILPRKSHRNGLRKIDRIRASVQEAVTKSLPPITVSGGTSSLRTVLASYELSGITPNIEQIAHTMYVFSDFALYTAKENGKNQITDFDDAIAKEVTSAAHQRLGVLVEIALQYRDDLLKK